MAKKPTTIQPPLIRLANRRVPNAVKALGLVGNLGNYEPTEKQTEVIIDAIARAFEEMQNKLKRKEHGWKLIA